MHSEKLMPSPSPSLASPSSLGFCLGFCFVLDFWGFVFQLVCHKDFFFCGPSGFGML